MTTSVPGLAAILGASVSWRLAAVGGAGPAASLAPGKLLHMCFPGRTCRTWLPHLQPDNFPKHPSWAVALARGDSAMASPQCGPISCRGLYAYIFYLFDRN